MADRPMLFSGPLVRAIREGRKTETRRPMKPQPVLDSDGRWAWPCSSARGFIHFDDPQGREQLAAHCPIAEKGDRLWVRETWRTTPGSAAFLGVDKRVEVEYRADESKRLIESEAGHRYFWDKGHKRSGWTPSIHMPRWASRLNLRITEVRAEQVQDITNDGALAEGIGRRSALEQVQEYKNSINAVGMTTTGLLPNPQGTAERREFTKLWKQIYGPESWDTNAWVWVLRFEVDQ